MSLTITLPADLEQSALAHAAKQGQDLSGFVAAAVREKIAKSKTLDEICAPFAKAVEASGISDAEFDDLIEEVRDKVWQEKHGRKT